MKNFAAFALYCCCSLIFSQAVWSQDFSSVDSDLASLEGLITDTLTTTEAQLAQLDDLKLHLSESELLLDRVCSILPPIYTTIKNTPSRSVSAPSPPA